MVIFRCHFTSIQINASPFIVNLTSCHYLKEVITKKSEYETLEILSCIKFSLSKWFVGDTVSIPQLISLYLRNIDDKIVFKAECPNLKKAIFCYCSFTSIEVDASPSELTLSDCQYLKKFKTKQTRYRSLLINRCPYLPSN